MEATRPLNESLICRPGNGSAGGAWNGTGAGCDAPRRPARGPRGERPLRSPAPPALRRCRACRRPPATHGRRPRPPAVPGLSHAQSAAPPAGAAGFPPAPGAAPRRGGWAPSPSVGRCCQRRARPARSRDLDLTVRILLYSAIFLLSILGNALVIVVLAVNKRLRTVTNSFLLSLALSDLMVAAFCMPFTFIPNLMRTFVFGKAVCKTMAYLM
ncbi:gastrin/cholecystokinin type B receptor-like, partial [Tiliqua scincoides]|uniref:gastrin/cholecystokinin type B receptor-like n=1 Tax=Tiliqua scincoides TaxID=71010 RepID=UPI003461A484